MCARRRWFERMGGGETKKNPKRKRVKRLEKERKKERKTEEEEGRNNTETVQKQSMPIKCFVALQWKIFSFVLWKFSRRVEAASFSHSFISTLDQSVCIIWQAWKTMRKQISSAEVLIFFSVNSFASYFFIWIDEFFLFEIYLMHFYCLHLIWRVDFDFIMDIFVMHFIQISWFQTVVLLQEIKFVWILSMVFQSVIHLIL